jgi:hypothetical protein
MTRTINREHFTLVFKGDIGKFEKNPMNTETPFGKPVAAGRGDAFEEHDRTERNRDMWQGQCERQAAQLTDMRAALQGMVDNFKPFTSRQMGGPNSDARLEQEAQISAYARATSMLSRAVAQGQQSGGER